MATDFRGQAKVLKVTGQQLHQYERRIASAGWHKEEIKLGNQTENEVVGSGLFIDVFLIFMQGNIGLRNTFQKMGMRMFGEGDKRSILQLSAFRNHLPV
jgi:hypothetical protein